MNIPTVKQLSNFAVMINKDLDKTDLTNMVKGTTPAYKDFEHPLVKKSGYYTGGLVEKWSWHYRFEDALTEEELLQLYHICK